MKNILLFGIGLFLVLNSVFAQESTYSPEAKQILDKLSAKYSTMASYQAMYHFKLSNKNDEVFSEDHGRIYVKGEKFKIIENRQEIIFDGNSIWAFVKDVNEVNVSDAEDLDEQITPANVYNLYKKGFKYIYWGQLKDENELLQVVELQPEHNSKKMQEVVKIRLFIRKSNNTLKRIVVIGSADIKQVYDIVSVTSGVNLPDTDFAFNKDKHPGVKVIDLR